MTRPAWPSIVAAMSTTQTSTSHCQVLIVGAGPTGLVLAAQLLARGVRTRVIDKGEGPARQSRAVSIYARTLELLDTMELAETFIAHGHQVRRLHWYAGQRTLLNLDLARNGSQFGFVLHLPQNETERLLRARVRDLGGVVEQGVELVRLAQHGNAVDATLREATGRDIELSADYVVGCDGAHSRVRHELGLAFEGQPYPQDWLLADVALDGAGRDDEAHMFFRPNGLPLVCAPMGRHRWRVVMPNAGDRGGRPPSFEEIQDLVDQRAPRRIVVSDPAWLSCFRCQLRSTTTYRRGRVLLAGDAAHIHSPAGGQGMNTGMIDAQNLAWKLTLVTGGAPDAVLDTYERERVPVASSVLGFTDRLIGWATMRHPVKRALRDTLIPAATALPVVQNRAARRLSQLSVAYPASPLNRPDGIRRGPKPGERVPDIKVGTADGSATLYRVLGRGRHVLLVSGAETRQAAEASGLARYAPLVDIVDTDLRATHRPGKDASAVFALVRPDGVLAVRGGRRDTHTMLDYLRGISAADTPQPVGLAHPSAVAGSH
jgi:2-polyprenyl-6-methoxyphenol hydroxylase-like FAD-dependent oxidoreductase